MATFEHHEKWGNRSLYATGIWRGGWPRFGSGQPVTKTLVPFCGVRKVDTTGYKREEVLVLTALTMRVLAVLFLLLVSASVAQNSTKAPVSITLSSPHSEYVVGQPIEIDIVLENISNNEISVAKSNARGKAELSYEIDVLDGTGRRAPYLRWGKILHGQDPGDGRFGVVSDSQQTHQLQPKATLSDSAVLNTIYDLSSPGQYVIQVTKKLFPGTEPSQPVSSNAIKITIAKPGS